VRPVDLGRVAAQAELLRVQHLLGRQIMRAVWAGVAVIFLIAMLVMLHIVAYLALQRVLIPLWDASAILGFDLVIAVLCGMVAARSTPSTLETDAKQIRDQALSEIKEGLAVGAIVSLLGRLAFRAAGRKNVFGMTLAALAARFLSKRQ
jgi:hypothetical protein